jgi:serine/threonine protein kinase
VAQILIDMAIGLSHVHESGFMHLDFKPENVLVSRNGNVQMIDFDLAQPIPGEAQKNVEEPGHARLHGAGTTAAAADRSARGYFCLRRRGLRIIDEPESLFPARTPAEILAGNWTLPVRCHRASIMPTCRRHWRRSFSGALPD